MIAFGLGRGFLPFAIRVAAIAAAIGLAIPQPADARQRSHRSKPSQAAAATSGDQWRSGYSAIIVDANTGKVLHEADADALRHPASITKIMTLYLLFEQLDAGRLRLDSQLPVSAHASGQDPTKLGLRPGSTIEVEDAIKGVVTRSANDAAVVIAEAVGGDEPSFAALMTRKARALGMSRTTFRNASGLPNPEQVTTARDMSVLGRAIQERFPRYYRFFSTRQFAWRGDLIANHNKLLGRVEGVDGIKTGYTHASGFNLVSSVRRDGRHIVGVVLGGRSGASRDARMTELIETLLPRAYAGGQTAPRIAESEPRGPGAPMALASVRADQLPTAAIPRPAPGSTEPLRPNAVRSVQVGPANTSAPLGAIVTRTSPSAPPTYTTASVSSAPGQIAPAVITIAPAPAPAVPRGTFAPAPQTLDAQAARGADVQSARSAEAPAARAPMQVASAAQVPATPASAALSSAVAHVSHSEWMIQIGAFPVESQARDKLREAQNRNGGLLGAADPFTEKVVKGSTALYRARFAGFDEERAREACRVLKKSNFACMPLKN